MVKIVFAIMKDFWIKISSKLYIAKSRVKIKYTKNVQYETILTFLIAFNDPASVNYNPLTITLASSQSYKS